MIKKISEKERKKNLKRENIEEKREENGKKRNLERESVGWG